MSALEFSRDSIARLESAFEREWLVTNGLGGFAAGTVALANTRRYHGLLVAAMRPPVERYLLVAKVDAVVIYRGVRYSLAVNEFADGTLAAQGLDSLVTFELDGQTPVWTFACGDALIEQRIRMVAGENTTQVSYELRHATAPVELELTPLCGYRDYHSHMQGGWSLGVDSSARGVRIDAFPGAHPYSLSIDSGTFRSDPAWYWRFKHRVEQERGLDATEDLFRPGTFQSRLRRGEVVTVTLTSDAAALAATATAEGRSTRLDTKPQVVGRPDDPAWVRTLRRA
jgi:predicted glycogen debranching enzyme